MVAQTLLLDFVLHEDFDYESCVQKVKDMLEEQLVKAGTNSSALKEEMRHCGEHVDTIMYSGQGDLMVMIRIDKQERLLTLNIDAPYLSPSGSQFKDKNQKNSPQLFHHQSELVKFESSLSKKLGVDSSSLLPVLTRGMELTPYWTTTDDRIVECSIKSVLHQDVSEYQKIQILDTIDFGRTLVLDGQVNLSEADLIYTLTLMNEEEYGGADVLILGGGDGALLALLLKAAPSPSHVTMVELDQAVMTAVATHMPAVADGVLDSLHGAHYDIIVGDAVKHLEKCREEGKLFDFVFGDLTDIPIDTDKDGKDVWDFISLILELSFSCIKPGGKYLTHVTGKALPASKELFREKVELVAKTIKRKTKISFTEAFVPSFMEVWVFSQVTLAPDDGLE